MKINTGYNQPRINFNVSHNRNINNIDRQIPIKREERVNIELNEKPKIKRKIINIQK